MRIARTVVLIAAILLSGACTGPATKPPPPHPVSRYANSLEGPIKAMRKTWLTYAVAGCIFAPSPVTPTSSVGGSNSVCARGPMTLNTEAKSLVLQIQSADDPHAALYIGAPPAELVTLVAETKAAAQQVDDDIDDRTQKAAEDWWRDVAALMRVFDRWDPFF